MNISKEFQAGDYVTAAMEGTPQQWEYHAARGFLGKPKEAIAALCAFDTDQARFYSAALSWFSGDEDSACRGLENLTDPHAQNLLKIIRKPTINVLSQLPWSRGGPTVLLEGAHLDPKFKIQNIGFHEGDLPNRPYANVHDFYDAKTKPDFFIANMIEWHLIPPNLGELDCPLIGHTSDFDVHIQGAYHWLRLFDELMVCDHAVEYEAVRKITGRPVTTFVKTFGHPFEMPLPPNRERDIDVFISGSLFNAYHPDKALHVQQILRVPNLNVVFVNGHISTEDYLNFVSRAKVTPSYCRHWGGALTRAMESLCMGSVSLVQEGSIHTLWASEEQGLLTYPDAEGPGKMISHVLANYDHYKEKIGSNIGTLRDEFDPKTVSSQYFRHCTFLAARPRGKRDVTSTTDLIQKRMIMIRGWVPANSDRRVLKEICDSNVERYKWIIGRANQARHINDLARELLIYHGNLALEPNRLAPSRDELDESIRSFRTGVDLFPLNLPLRFNLMRVLLHFGSEDEFTEGLSIASKILEKPDNEWDVSLLDDVLPYDMFNHFFNYRNYLDLVIEEMRDGTDVRSALRHHIIASVSHYLGRHKDDAKLLAHAVELDGSFPFYKLSLAEFLLYEDDVGDERLARCKELLLDLANTSQVAISAYWMLRQLEMQFGQRQEEVMALDPIIAVAERSTFLTESHFQKLTTKYYLSQRLNLTNSNGFITHKINAAPSELKLSVVLVDRAGTQAATRLPSLLNQSAPRNSYEIVYVELFERFASSIEDQADTLLTCGQNEYLHHKNCGFNTGLTYAQGQLVVFSEGLAKFPMDYIEKINIAFDDKKPMIILDTCAHFRENPRGNPIHALVCRRDDAVRVQGFDQHEYFFGAYGGVEELAWRMQRSGIKVFIFENGNLERIKLEPWWKVSIHAEFSVIGSVADRIWPRLFKESRTSPLLADAHMTNLANATPKKTTHHRLLLTRVTYRLMKVIHFLSGVVLSEIDQHKSFTDAMRRLMFIFGRSVARTYFSPSLYRRVAAWYVRRWGKN